MGVAMGEATGTKILPSSGMAAGTAPKRATEVAAAEAMEVAAMETTMVKTAVMAAKKSLVVGE